MIGRPILPPIRVGMPAVSMMCLISAVVVDLPLVPVDADDLVPGQVASCLGEQLDIADHGYAELNRMTDDRMPVQRHARRDDHALIAGQVDLQRIGEGHVALHLRARFLPAVPRRHRRAAGQQRFDRGQARAGQSEDGIGFAGEGAARDHRSLSVARPARARTKAMIQKRITTVGSLQPSCSK